MLVHHITYSFGRIWLILPGLRIGYFGKASAVTGEPFGWKRVHPDDYHNCWLHGD